MVRINWYESQKAIQLVDEMYLSRLFGEDNSIDWNVKADADKTWKTCKSYFKDL